MFAILGWDKEEMMKYHAQAFTVIKICQLLCTVFKDAKQMEPQSRLTQVPTCFNNIILLHEKFLHLIGFEQ